MFRGQPIHFPVAPRLDGGRLSAPVKPFFEKLGARLWHDSGRDEWHVRHGDREIRFRVGDHRAYCGTRVIFLVHAPYLYGGYVYCPLGPFADALRVPYRWNEYTYTAEVYPTYVPEPAEPFISKELAVATASEYLAAIGQYPDYVVEVAAHENTAPANYYWDAVGAGRKITRPAAPWIAVPTTAGTGAEVTKNAVIACPERRYKASIRGEQLLASAVIVDAELHVGVPPDVTAPLLSKVMWVAALAAPSQVATTSHSLSAVLV